MKNFLETFKNIWSIKELRDKLVYEHHIFVGNSNQPNTLRLLPSLTISKNEVDILMDAISKILTK